MYIALPHTGKEINPFSNAHHVIKCTVNNALTSFTVTDNEKCSFGLYDRNNRLLGYLYRHEMNICYPKCAAINGTFDIVIRDVPEGTTVRKIESFFLNASGGVTNVLH